MNLRQEYSQIDGLLHQQNVSLLMGSQAASTFAAFRSSYPGIWDTDDEYGFFAGSALVPRMTWVWNVRLGQILIILNGMQNNDKIAACLNGWSNPRYGQDNLIYPYQTAAVAANQGLPTRGPGNVWGQVRIIGHSYGGCVGMYLANILQGVGESAERLYYTYGAPKIGIQSQWSNRIVNQMRRVFLSQDPVPLLPLSYHDLSALWTITGVPTARAWSLWGNFWSGYTQTDRAELVQSQMPSFQQWSGPVFSLTSWATGIRAFGADRHTLAAYYQAMIVVPAVNAPASFPATRREDDRIERPTAVQLEAARGVAVVEAQQLTGQDPGGAVRGIQSGVPIKHGEIYHGTKIGRDNVILYDGQVVGYAPTRRVRRAMVRELNRGLRFR